MDIIYITEALFVENQKKIIINIVSNMVEKKRDVLIITNVNLVIEIIVKVYIMIIFKILNALII